MKYKIGDIVTIRSDLESGVQYFDESGNFHDIVIPDMLKYRGQEVMVVRVLRGAKYRLGSLSDKSHAELPCNWTDQMLEPVLSEPFEDTTEMDDFIRDMGKYLKV